MTQTSNRPPSETLNVLVADDDPIFGALATSSLTRAGFDVVLARDGSEAFGALERGRFDLALVDLSMPRVDGFRLIALIRSTPHLATLPIVVLSSLNDVEAVEEAYALGANAFLSKPINWALLPVHIRHVLRLADQLTEVRRRLRTLEAALPPEARRPAA